MTDQKSPESPNAEYQRRFSAATSDMERIRLYYGAPAEVGSRVQCIELRGKPWGTVIDADGYYLRVRQDNGLEGLFHPGSLIYNTTPQEAPDET